MSPNETLGLKGSRSHFEMCGGSDRIPRKKNLHPRTRRMGSPYELLAVGLDSLTLRVPAFLDGRKINRAYVSVGRS